MKRLASIIAVCALAGVPVFAQQSRFTGFVGGGFSEPVWDIGTRLNTGWNATAGAGVNINPRFGVMVDFMFNNFDINRATLNSVQAPDGTTRVWAFTLDPVVHLTGESPVDVYITGGGGIYHRTVEFTQPTVATVPFFDPFFGVFYPGNIAVNQVIGSYSNYKGGLDGGMGVAFRLGSSNVKLFAEAKYHHMFTAPTPTVIVPVSFGIRW